MANEQQTTLSEDLVAVGDLIDKRFLVTRKIKSGGFGQVYEAQDTANGNAAVALKMEDRHSTPVLGHEVQVLSRMKGYRHVAKMYGCGKVENRINYIAMQLLGINLSDLRRQSPCKQAARFSPGTAARLCSEWLEAITDLHETGYIHRDIKASNFTMGRTPRTRRVVYLIDYGMARLHVLPSGAVVPERPRVSFRGTVRYASIAAHRLRDLGRKDDLISLFYSIAEAFHGRLPWRHLRDKKSVLKVKESVDTETICRRAPSEVATMGGYLQTLRYADRPDYAMLAQLFRGLNARLGTKPSDPYDWECDWKSLRGTPAKVTTTTTTKTKTDLKRC